MKTGTCAMTLMLELLILISFVFQVLFTYLFTKINIYSKEQYLEALGWYQSWLPVE